jgi:hypothetical protein
VAEHPGLQPGEPVAATGAAEGDREMVADQVAAAADEEWGSVGQTRAVLLAAAGGGASDAAALWEHAEADGGAGATGRVGAPLAGRENRGRGGKRVRVCEGPPGDQAFGSFRLPGRGGGGRFAGAVGPLQIKLLHQRGPAKRFGCNLCRAYRPKWKSRFSSIIGFAFEGDLPCREAFSLPYPRCLY